MEQIVKFAIDDIQIIEAENYPTDEFAIARLGFLGSNPNSHKLDISNDVLKTWASTVLGKFVVADINPLTQDCTTHTTSETIKGYFPMEQEVVFKEREDGYIRAYADAVISKIYAPDFCQIFENGDSRDVSVEMTMQTLNGNDLDDTVLSFNIVGVTALGRGIRPSSPNSDMQFTRFSEEEASAYFEKTKEVKTTMEKFARERRKSMAEEKYVNHPIDTSKEAVYDGEWDGEKAKQDLIKEEKYETLASKVCLRLEEGWKDRQVTKLGYPVMCLNDGKWVYSKKGLASALGYAKQHDDNDIVSKVEAIYKKLGLDSDRKEESAKMTEIEFAAVDIGAMWEKLYDALRDRYPYGDYGSLYWIDSIWEEDNKKYAIIRKRDEDDLWRLDFSYTEEGLVLADEIVKIEIEMVETDTIRKFAEPEDVTKYQEVKCEDTGDDKDKNNNDDQEGQKAEMSVEDLQARIAGLEQDVAERDNIIMEKDAELEELRQFKAERLEQDKAKVVANVMDSVEEFMDKAELEACRTEGMACQFAEIDAWSNKVKASIVDKALKKSKKDVSFTRIAGVDDAPKKSTNVWDRI